MSKLGFGGGGKNRTAAEQASVDQASKRYESGGGEGEIETGQEEGRESGISVGLVEGEFNTSTAEVFGTSLLEVGNLATRADFVDMGNAETPEELAAGAPVPLWKQMYRVFVANRLAVASTLILIIIVLGCFLGPHFYHTNQTNASQAIFQPENLPPSSAHLLGTDSKGYDVLGRNMFAGQYSLTLGLFAGIITIIVGTVYGMVSGFFGGVLDAVLMRFLDVCLSVPYLFLLITLVFVFGNSTEFLILVIGLTGWWGNARIIRGDALVIRDLEYSQAASSMGAKRMHIVRRHVFPNSISNIVTVGTFSVADAILFLSALGFLGLGIQLPATDWGTMMYGGTQLLIDNYWWEVYPVAAVFVIVVVCINYIGDAMRDIFEVRLRER
jgi:peptide/nickel transport system permease protein